MSAVIPSSQSVCQFRPWLARQHECCPAPEVWRLPGCPGRQQSSLSFVRCRSQLCCSSASVNVRGHSVVTVSVPVPPMASQAARMLPGPWSMATPGLPWASAVVSVIRALSQSVLLYCIVEDVCCYAVRTSTQTDLLKRYISQDQKKVLRIIWRKNVSEGILFSPETTTCSKNKKGRVREKNQPLLNSPPPLPHTHTHAHSHTHSHTHS